MTEMAPVEQATTRVGFVGLGVMGTPMVTNIAASQRFDVSVYDVDSNRAREVARELDVAAETQVEGLADREVIVLMLPTSAIVRSVLLTEDNALRIPLRPGTVIVDMSSSDPVETTETGALLAQHGVDMIDAPVSGARERAAAGTLSIMLGANDEAAAQKSIPVIETMSSRIFRTGALGSGHAMKALNNYVAAACFVASAEALEAGTRFGLDPATVVEVLNASTGQNFSSLNVFPEHIVKGAYATGFALPLITKDVRIAARLQQEVGHRAPVCDAVAEALGDALDELGNVDHSLAYEHWRKH